MALQYYPLIMHIGDTMKTHSTSGSVSWDLDLCLCPLLYLTCTALVYVIYISLKTGD